MIILSLEKGIVVFEKVSKILHPKIWTNPATRVLTFYHGDLAGTPQPLGNNSRSKFLMGICKVRLHFSGGSRGGARGVSTKPRSEGPKKFFGRPPPAPLSNGLDDRPQPPHLPTISRSGSGTTISILNFCLMNKGSSFLRSDNFYIWMWSMLK